jgi:aryl-alcohol dehydrogenase-like predicted oxidoreductase
MQKRKLGQGLEVSAIGFGCMGLNFGYGTGRHQGGRHCAHPSGL